jgi:hypothetical protein
LRGEGREAQERKDDFLIILKIIKGLKTQNTTNKVRKDLIHLSPKGERVSDQIDGEA